MAKPNSTIVVVTGTDAASVLRELDGLPNVRAASTTAQDSPAAADLISHAHTAYVVHDDDPLADIASAWSGFYDDTVPAGTLEVAVSELRRSLRSGSVTLPDYFVVLDPESLPTTLKHWWFGMLATLSPTRVLPSAPAAGAVQHLLGALPPGRWWPEPLDDWLDGIARVAPDALTFRAPQ